MKKKISALIIRLISTLISILLDVDISGDWLEILEAVENQWGHMFDVQDEGNASYK